MKNYKMVIQYDGTKYDGWQRQGNSDRTIEGKLEEVLSRMAGHPVEVHGSGRTDAGVHALAQTANFHADVRMEEADIRAYLNQYLPEDIAVLSLVTVPDRFHSRLNACEKTYLYRIETGKKKDVFERKFICGLGEALDVKAMRQAAALLTGEHDFKSFCANKKMKKSAVRNLYSIGIETEGTKLLLRFTGDGFLYNMVRILTGTLIEVGQHKRKAEEMSAILEAGDRQAAGFTAPPEGLFLECVKYRGQDD